MTNEKIIFEFKRLIEYTKNKIDLLKKEKNIKEANNLNFKIRIFNNVISAIKSFSKVITIDNYKELLNVQGIGKGSVERIKDILIKIHTDFYYFNRYGNHLLSHFYEEFKENISKQKQPIKKYRRYTLDDLIDMIMMTHI